jgi:hypothetical protein
MKGDAVGDKNKDLKQEQAIDPEQGLGEHL